MQVIGATILSLAVAPRWLERRLVRAPRLSEALLQWKRSCLAPGGPAGVIWVFRNIETELRQKNIYDDVTSAEVRIHCRRFDGTA